MAHNKDLSVAYRLHDQYPSVWNIFGKGWILEVVIYWLFGPLFILDVSCLLLLAYSAREGVFKSFAPHLMRRQTA